MAGARVQALGGDDPATLGPYRLIGRLASGGMGRIYLARGAEHGGRGLVAVKTLLAEGTVSDVDRRRFAREVSLAQRVNSAYTARVRDADPDADRPWMAIDYIAAPPLSELVRTCGVLPASAVRWIAAGTAEALVTLHGVGIVHRDVKPQNVLLPLDGPRVIDFGISHASDLTLTGLTLGTIAFTSPNRPAARPRPPRPTSTPWARPSSCSPPAGRPTPLTATPCGCWPASSAANSTSPGCRRSSSRRSGPAWPSIRRGAPSPATCSPASAGTRQDCPSPTAAPGGCRRGGPRSSARTPPRAWSSRTTAAVPAR